MGHEGAARMHCPGRCVPYVITCPPGSGPAPGRGPGWLQDSPFPVLRPRPGAEQQAGSGDRHRWVRHSAAELDGRACWRPAPSPSPATSVTVNLAEHGPDDAMGCPPRRVRRSFSWHGERSVRQPDSSRATLPARRNRGVRCRTEHPGTRKPDDRRAGDRAGPTPGPSARPRTAAHTDQGRPAAGAYRDCGAAGCGPRPRPDPGGTAERGEPFPRARGAGDAPVPEAGTAVIRSARRPGRNRPAPRTGGRTGPDPAPGGGLRPRRPSARPVPRAASRARTRGSVPAGRPAG